MNLYIGLMSGTSIDAIDAVLVNFTDRADLITAHSEPIPMTLKQELNALCQTGNDEINRLGAADVAMGQVFANACEAIIQKSHINKCKIKAIGSHGQTIRHRPDLGFTLQIGDPNIIAAKTNITTIADFRRRDMALNGQGAPLTPLFHRELFSNKQCRVIVNIGGITNLTVLDKQRVIGFDSGPGNTLLDKWAQKHLNAACDKEGQWAAQGIVDEDLLNLLKADHYFQRPLPKSTGREYFNLSWLNAHLQTELTRKNIQPIEIQATLLELTASTIIDAILLSAPKVQEIFICGGGVHNTYLMQRLKSLANKIPVQSTQALGIDPDWLEAMAFAWFAKRTLAQQPSNLPEVTGATKPAILGGVYYAT